MRAAAASFGALLLTVSSACGDQSRPASLPVPAEVGTVAPHYEATALGGEAVRLGGSDAPTLVNVWATWCTSCREEFAELERIRLRHESAGLKVLAVSVDQGGDEKVKRFAAAQGGRFPVVHDREGRISKLYGVVGLPSTYLIGRDGSIQWALTGSFLEAKDAMERAIVAELAAK